MNRLLRLCHLLFAFAITMTYAVFGQSARQMYYFRYIRIDTLIGLDRHPKASEKYPIIQVVDVVDPWYISTQQRAYHYGFEKPAAVHYNYVAELLLLDTADQITLLVDTRGSQVVLKGIRRIEDDTLRISRWEILENNLPRSVKGSVYFHRVFGDSTDYYNPFRVERIDRKVGDSVIRLPTVTTTICGRPFHLTLDTFSTTSIRHAHGGGPKKRYIRHQYKRKSQRLPKRRTRSRLYYFSSREFTKELHYSGEIQLY